MDLFLSLRSPLYRVGTVSNYAKKNCATAIRRLKFPLIGQDLHLTRKTLGLQQVLV